ncbi:hypothetical protein Adt_10001 [Abeliophyllum distichum]|uniref:Uncharacterized protein n=1 Tax=Abeliophyllum distichum TaxID=126358 RepID=A0ABD1UJ29_9LAMI
METTKIVSNLPLIPSVITNREEASDVDTEDGAIFLLAAKWEKSPTRLFSCKRGRNCAGSSNDALAGEGLQLQRGRAWRREGLREGRGCAVAKVGAARTRISRREPVAGEGRTDFAKRTSSQRSDFSRDQIPWRFRADITHRFGGYAGWVPKLRGVIRFQNANVD